MDPIDRPYPEPRPTTSPPVRQDQFLQTHSRSRVRNCEDTFGGFDSVSTDPLDSRQRRISFLPPLGAAARHNVESVLQCVDVLAPGAECVLLRMLLRQDRKSVV